MTKRPLLLTVAVLALAALGYWIFRHTAGGEPLPYRFVAIERGNLESAVSATGALSAVSTVQVGTQVSGRIVAIHADFNDRVEKGELIARIDPLLQQQAVREAEAGLERARAELEKAQLDHQRSVRLFESRVLTENDLATTKYALAVAGANLKTGQVNLERARQNLAYTSIYAPIDGVVVERNVDVGQTVQASMSTPQLFLIANDLARMQILASVDESDIGLIREGQAARFTVQAYSAERFTGTVQQVRLQSKTAENVVNYTVVVSVENPGGRLLPGMTATVEFLTGSASDVLLVPNAALRFRPPQQVLGRLREERSSGSAAGESASGAPRPRGVGQGNPQQARNAGMATLWQLDAKGDLAPLRVRTGITDGQKTEVRSDEIRDGMQVVVGMVQTEQSGTANPFQPAAPARPAPRPGTF